MKTRREFIQTLAVAAGALVILPGSEAAAKKVAFGLDKAEKLKEVGGSTILKIKDQPVLLIRDSATTVRALDPTCTHERCQVAYSAANKQIECPCHKSHYDLTGKPVSGPARANLKTFPATLEGERIVVDLG